MEITIKNGNVEVASGELEVISGQPATASFTPDGGTQSNCTAVVWNVGANGTVGFHFQVTGQANGDFPCGPNGTNFTYRFTGNQNANGSAPSGQVNFPSAGIQGDDNDTWQGGASEDAEDDEPYAESKTAG